MEELKEEDKSFSDPPLVHGGLWKTIWLMSWPLIISTVANSIVGMVDVQVAGFLGSNAQAAVGLAEHVIFTFMVFLFSVSVGTTAIVSRAFGQKDLNSSIKGLSQSLILSVSAGLVLALLAFLFAKLLLPLFCSSQAVIREGYKYLTVYSLYMIPFSIICISTAAFRAIGNTKTPLLIVASDVIVNIAGDYLTVCGNFPIKNLGVYGIAGSAVVGATVGACVAIYSIFKSPLKEALFYLKQIDFDLQRRLLKIGLPSAFQRLGWTLSVFVLFFILKHVDKPTAALAAWTIGIRIEGILFMPLMALGLAVSAIVGQNLGAGQKERALKAGWNVALLGVICMLILSSFLFIFSSELASIMTNDPDTQNFTTTYLRFNAFSEPFLAIAMILMGAMQGAGDTKMPMWISLFSNWLIRLPLAWLLAISLHKGPDGVWTAMIISVLISCSLCIWRYNSRKWMLDKI